jgi:dehydrogenase/reductase SDR family protein 1
MKKKLKPLDGKVALVTGATRGIGKGIALQLADAGAVVYITGRTVSKNHSYFGSLQETADAIKKRNGKCIPIRVDHENDHEVAELFRKIDEEQDGRLDILVNNVFKAANTMIDNRNLTFWEMKPEVWDDFNNVGLRNHYVCTVFASRLMVRRRTGGLIVFISSVGGTFSLGNVPYCVGKAGIDRMAADCGIELRNHNVACVSLCVGAVRTEFLNNIAENVDNNEVFFKNMMNRKIDGKTLKYLNHKAESCEFAGKCIVRLACERNIMQYTSKVIIAADYAQTKKIVDIDNRKINSFRQINSALDLMLPDRLKFLSWLIPNFVKIPKTLLTLFTCKYK